MFGLFTKKKDSVSIASEGWAKVGKYVHSKQRQLGDWLNLKAAALSPGLLTALIILVCVSFASASTYLIVRSFKWTIPFSKEQQQPIHK